MTPGQGRALQRSMHGGNGQPRQRRHPDIAPGLATTAEQGQQDEQILRLQNCLAVADLGQFRVSRNEK